MTTSPHGATPPSTSRRPRPDVPEAVQALDPHGARVQHMFSDIAHGYDQANRVMSMGIDVRWRRRAVTGMVPEGSPGGARRARILDLCAGTLDSTLEIHRQYPEADITAGDFSANMLARGREKLDAAAAARITTRDMDAHNLPEKTGSFDALFCAFGVRNLSDLERATAEMARCLRAGGRLTVLEFFRPTELSTRVFHALHKPRGAPPRRLGRDRQHGRVPVPDAEHRRVRHGRGLPRAARAPRLRRRDLRAPHARHRLGRPGHASGRSQESGVKLVVCVTGASGSLYARRALHLLSRLRRQRPRTLRVDWVASSNAPLVWRQELAEDMPTGFDGLTRWDRVNFMAPFASGSSAPDAVLVMPCSMSTLARVANGGGDDLIARTCEVALKERKRLILVVRETPLSLVHLRNMVSATEAGALVLPAVPSFYGAVRTLEQAVDTVIARALDRAGVDLPEGFIQRWGADEPSGKHGPKTTTHADEELAR